jgi:hypothetical protein
MANAGDRHPWPRPPPTSIGFLSRSVMSAILIAWSQA